MTHAEFALDVNTESSEPVTLSTGGANSNSKSAPLFLSSDEVFFWTKEWQTGEAESAREREAGNTRTFSSAEDVLKWLQADVNE